MQIPITIESKQRQSVTISDDGAGLRGHLKFFSGKFEDSGEGGGLWNTKPERQTNWKTMRLGLSSNGDGKGKTLEAQKKRKKELRLQTLWKGASGLRWEWLWRRPFRHQHPPFSSSVMWWRLNVVDFWRRFLYQFYRYGLRILKLPETGPILGEKICFKHKAKFPNSLQLWIFGTFLL